MIEITFHPRRPVTPVHLCTEYSYLHFFANEIVDSFFIYSLFQNSFKCKECIKNNVFSDIIY